MSAVVTALVLLLTINGLMLDPIHALAAAGQDARTDAVQAVLVAACWSAVVAAGGVLLGSLLAIGEGMMGAVAKGINVGASAAVFGAAIFVAMATTATSGS